VGSVSLLKVALALLLFAGGLAAALVALDVRAWRDELTAADARYEAGAQETWRVDERLPGSPAAALLAVDDDREAREAFARFRRAYSLSRDPLRGQEAEGVRGQAERALARVAAGSGPAAAQATVLLGVLGFDQPQGPERAVRAFGQALRLDGGNVAAKFDLELALRLLAPAGARPGDGTGRGAGRNSGAGAGEAGEGY
jgi:hypothetical protein